VVEAAPTAAPPSLGRSKPTQSCEWLRHFLAASRYLAAPFNQVLYVLLESRLSEDKLNAAKWLEISAHLGIVAGLALVAFQIAQQDQIADIDIASEVFSEATDHYESLIGENPSASLARAVENPLDLSTEDHIVLFNLYMAEFSKAMRLETLGEAYITDRYVDRWIGMLGNPYGYAWWQVMGPRLSKHIPNLSGDINRRLDELVSNHSNTLRVSIDEIDQMLHKGD